MEGYSGHRAHNTRSEAPNGSIQKALFLDLQAKLLRALPFYALPSPRPNICHPKKLFTILTWLSVYEFRVPPRRVFVFL